MKSKKGSFSSKKHRHEKNLQAITAFLVLCIGLAVFFIFNNYQENLLNSSNIQSFIILAIVLAGFLIGLLYLLNPKR